MKRPPQIAEELEEKEVCFWRYRFSNFTTHFVIFSGLLNFFCSYFLFTGEKEAGPDSILYSWS